MAYKYEINKYGDLMTIKDFISDVSAGYLIDYDGFCHPVKDNKYDSTVIIYPSNLVDTIPKDATHIIWFNR